MAEVDERFEQRRAEVRRTNRSRRLWRTITVLILLVVLAAAWAVERSWLVELAEIQVTGTQRLEPAVVLDAADLELGTSTLRLRLGPARERVEALPLVAHADVRRIGAVAVRIDIVERVPELVGRLGESGVLVDAEGIVIATGQDPVLTQVRVSQGRLPQPGVRLGPDSALGAGHRVWQGLSGPLRAEVDHIEARSSADVDVLLADGTRVRFGRPDLLDEKVRALGALLEELAGERVRVIDVRAPANPTVS